MTSSSYAKSTSPTTGWLNRLVPDHGSGRCVLPAASGNITARRQFTDQILQPRRDIKNSRTSERLSMTSSVGPDHPFRDALSIHLTTGTSDAGSNTQRSCCSEMRSMRAS